MRLLALSGAVLTLISSLLFFIKKDPIVRNSSLETVALMASAGNTYFGPKAPVKGNPQLIRVQLLAKDAQESSGPQLVSVTFYNRDVPLKPRDVHGNRGSASFQVPPGKYKLRWTTSRDKFAWPREEEHEEEITVSPRDLWLQLEIQGNQAQIN